MTNLQEVPTDELLSFQDYPTVHKPGNNSSAQITVQMANDFIKPDSPVITDPNSDNDPNSTTPASKSFWTIEYYQQFFDVDTKDVIERILASVTPKRDSTLKYHLCKKPDLYGPIWIAITLIFTIAISGNIANYLQHANAHYKWKYDFHLVSYAATAIFIYITLIPIALWGLLKSSSDVNDLDGLEADSSTTLGILELICTYGYSLFVYIPVSILWCIQISSLQWFLVLVAACISGSVLLFTLTPALKLSTYRLILSIGILGFHLLLAAGFMLYFFHVPNTTIVEHSVIHAVSPSTNISHKSI